MDKQKLIKIHHALNCLTLFREITEDKAVQCYSRLISSMVQGDTPLSVDILADYHRLIGFLLEEAVNPQLPKLGTAWQNYLLNRILFNNNLYARKYVTEESINSTLKEAFLHDLKNLQLLCQEGLQVLEEPLNQTPGVFLATSDPLPDSPGAHPLSDLLMDMKQKLLVGTCWSDYLADFNNFYQTAGFGQLAIYWAFRWEPGSIGFHLAGIENPDPIRLKQLIGYERQRKQVLSNTERLLQGQKAHNLILYGDRGTGKSSTVKALLHKYGAMGLRLVQISRKNLSGLQSLSRLLINFPQKFIIFIDDLSFEESETDYKEFKTQLEGSLEQQPSNICIYVTSNQRNLIKEYFSDRHTKMVDGEVHTGDTQQEKLSLADRFGLKITFIAPDKEVFLEIVRQLAVQEKINLDQATLERLALQWVLWNNERSGRTARQFIDHIKDRYDDLDIF
ncbi:ATP-binding protein [Desulfotomaculum defluvii]